MSDETRKRLSPLAFGAIIVVGLVLLGAFLSVSGLGMRLLGTYGPVLAGQEGHIVTDAPSMIVARDVPSFEAALSASPEMFQQMQADGKLFLVARGTRIRVLSADVDYDQIQILDGERAGAVGFMPAAFVQR
jgi:hypothetical protein